MTFSKGSEIRWDPAFLDQGERIEPGWKARHVDDRGIVERFIPAFYPSAKNHPSSTSVPYDMVEVTWNISHETSYHAVSRLLLIDRCPLCGEDRNHESQTIRGGHTC